MIKLIPVLTIAFAVLSVSALPDAASAHVRKDHKRHTHHHPAPPPKNCRAQAHRGTNNGALIGAVAGQAIGGNTKSTLVGAAGGAVIGHNVAGTNCKKRG
jgi:uncharacterized protein YcfJ